MHLSIFNFNKIIKIIIIFLILFISYNIYLLICTPNVKGFQNQWQKNTSTAQDFIYGNKKTNILVGSSLSARLSPGLLSSNDIYNLSFSGGSVLTGLELIKRSEYIPKTIYIETNMIFRSKSNNMLDKLFYPYWWKVKMYIPALREKYQLLNVLQAKDYCKKDKSNISNKKQKMIFAKAIKPNLSNEKIKKLEKIKNSKKFNIMIKQNLKKAEKKLYYKRQLNELKKLVSFFEKNGSKVVFFEAPMNMKLTNSNRNIQTRKIIKNSFKNNSWFGLPNSDYFYTSDGMHLVSYSAWIYSKEFIYYVKKINNLDEI